MQAKQKSNIQEFIQLSDLKITEDNIIIITTIYEAEKLFTEILSKESMIGLDSEWDHSLANLGTSIFHIGTRQKSYIIDFISIYKNEGMAKYSKLAGLINNLFLDRNIIKVAFSFGEDLKNLCYSFNINFEIESLCDLYFEIKTRERNNNFGLKILCYDCFGKDLNKSCQRSKWSSRPLKKPQIIYAAIDAYILLPLYDYFTQKPLHLKFYSSQPKPIKNKEKDQKLNPNKLNKRVVSTLKENFDGIQYQKNHNRYLNYI